MGAFSGGGIFGGQGLIPGMGGMNINGTGGSSLFGTPNPGGVPFSGGMGGSGLFGGNQGDGNPVQAMNAGGVGGAFGSPGLPGLSNSPNPSAGPLNNQGSPYGATNPNGVGNLLGGSPATLNNILPPGFQGVTEQAMNTGFLNIPQIMQGIETSSFPGFEQGMAGLSNLFGSNNASFGSEKSLGASNMSSQYAAQLAGIQSQLYEQQAQNQLGVFNTLEGQEATYKANEATPWDYVSDALGVGASLFGAGGMFGAFGAFGGGGGGGGGSDIGSMWNNAAGGGTEYF